MKSKSFEQFKYSCFDPSFGAGRNGLDVGALLDLTGPEREEAKRLILEALATTTDSRPIQAAGWLQVKAAEPILRGRLGADRDWDRPYLRVDAALALYRITLDTTSTEFVIDVIKEIPPSSEWTLMSALDALEELPDSVAVLNTLIERLESKNDGWVRGLIKKYLHKHLNAPVGEEFLAALPPQKRQKVERLVQG